MCIDALGSYACSCAPGYAGLNCEINVDDCAGAPCKNGGACIDLVGSFRCVCRVPYAGTLCETELDPCSPDPCRNGALCMPSSNYENFACSCNIGYSGKKRFFLPVQLIKKIVLCTNTFWFNLQYYRNLC